MINPWNIVKPVDGIPKVVISCYAKTTFDRMICELGASIFAHTSTANGIKPVYKANYKEIEVALFMMDVGAPMSGGLLEDLFQMGIEKAIVFGTCGVLDSTIEDCSIIVPDCAVRDEGTSYHYAPPADEIQVNKRYLGTLKKLLDELQVKYTVGKVWTTDAFYRETVEKVRRRKEQGCVCVDMECSANAAVAEFRGKDLIQFFYAADNLDTEEWDVRSLSNYDKLEEKDRIAAVALELARRIQ
ncbi:MAG: nucleoside phosphorylase [Fusicatenibacter sp.]|nr:nucleoside phosphorylase [Lachnospiraceae bacterium]MDY2938232.1 nucleoside phosphorylase [Fusicatenibacter sp.]